MGLAGKRFLLSASLLALAGCASNEPLATDRNVGPLVSFSGVSAISCPDDVTFVLPERIDVTSEAVPFAEGSSDEIAAYYAPLSPVVLYELNSDDARMGGISGLDFLDDDTLIMVTDDGSLIWLDLSEAGPDDHAFIATLRGSDGQPLDGKTYADSEGVAWNGETLFISFERGHRVLGYDIEGCGANARGAMVFDRWDGDFGAGIGQIDENDGIEGLAIRDAGELIIGVESRQMDGAAYGFFTDSTGSFEGRFPAPEITSLVGMDYVDAETSADRLYSLFRSYDPVRGNRIAIGLSFVNADGNVGAMERLVMIGSDVAVDNFEGITVQPVSETTDRIILISDNNFSPRQRTLLMVLEFEHG